MNQLYKKNGMMFAAAWIIIYVVGMSFADNLSLLFGKEKIITAVLGVVLTEIMLGWLRKNELFQEYGLCKSQIGPKKMLFYFPLLIMASVNLWHGIAMNYSVLETIFYIISMLSVGFLEEIIFRGLLFKELCKDNVKTAMIVSSVTFGIGHIVNLVNGSGADLFSNLLQVGYAIAAGFLFTIIFYKTKSLVVCIVTHGMLNALSVFSNEAVITPAWEIVSAAALAGISILYSIYIMRLRSNDA